MAGRDRRLPVSYRRQGDDTGFRRRGHYARCVRTQPKTFAGVRSLLGISAVLVLAGCGSPSDSPSAAEPPSPQQRVTQALDRYTEDPCSLFDEADRESLKIQEPPGGSRGAGICYWTSYDLETAFFFNPAPNAELLGKVENAPDVRQKNIKGYQASQAAIPGEAECAVNIAIDGKRTIQLRVNKPKGQDTADCETAEAFGQNVLVVLEAER